MAVTAYFFKSSNITRASFLFVPCLILGKADAGSIGFNSELGVKI